MIHADSPELAGLALDRKAPAMIPGIGSDVKDPASSELAYAEVPVAALKELFALTAVTRELLPRIVCPTLVLQSRDDHVVPPANGKTIANLVGASRVNWSGSTIPTMSRRSIMTKIGSSQRSGASSNLHFSRGGDIGELPERCHSIETKT